jgi:hypothetical protein
MVLLLADVHIIKQALQPMVNFGVVQYDQILNRSDVLWTKKGAQLPELWDSHGSYRILDNEGLC